MSACMMAFSSITAYDCTLTKVCCGKWNLHGNRYCFFFKNIYFWEYNFIMNKHNQRPTDVFNKEDVTVYLTYIKILEDLNIQRFKYLLIF